MPARTRLVGLISSLSLLAGCVPTAEKAPEGEELVSAYAALTNIPANTACLRFTSTPVPATGRTYEQLAPVTPGNPATLAIRGLPFNVPLSVTAEAFSQACADVDDKSLATWLSDTPASLTLTYGQIAPNLSFRLRPTGGANGEIDFLYFTLAPLSHSFGTGLLNQPTQPTNQTFTLVNAGTTATGTVTASVTGAHAASFPIMTNTCTGALAAGASCAVTLRCVPVSRGALTASLQFTGTPGGTISSALTATGQQPATLALSPATRDFGTVAQGQTSAASVFTVTNTGDVVSGSIGISIASTTPNETIASFSLQASPANCAAALNPGASCTYSILFTPRIGSALGAKTANLTVTASPGGSPVSALTGTAVAAPSISITPASVTFPTPNGGAPPTQLFTVRNTGGIAVGPLSLAMTGANPSEFPIGANGCGVSVPVGGTCTFQVSAQPTQAGTRTAQVVVTAMAGITASASLSITSNPLLVPNPTSIAFGSVSGSGSPARRDFTLRNSGVITLPGISFNSSAQYRVVSTNCNLGLAPGAICNASLEFDPPFPVLSNTSYPFTLRATANSANSVDIPVTGTGTP